MKIKNNIKKSINLLLLLIAFGGVDCSRKNLILNSVKTENKKGVLILNSSNFSKSFNIFIELENPKSDKVCIDSLNNKIAKPIQISDFMKRNYLLENSILTKSQEFSGSKMDLHYLVVEITFILNETINPLTYFEEYYSNISLENFKIKLFFKPSNIHIIEVKPLKAKLKLCK